MIVSLSLVAALATGELSLDEAQWLSPSIEVERALTACEPAHVYRFQLTQGETLRGFAEQDGINIKLRVTREPDEVLVATFDNRNEHRGRERFIVVAERTAEYRLAIHPDEISPTSGRYQLQAEAATATTDRDRLEAAAEGLLAAADEAPLAAMPGLLHQALLLCDAIESIECRADVLHDLAITYYMAGTDVPRGRDLLRQAAELRGQGNDRWAESTAWNDLGVLERALGELLDARSSFEKALPLRLLSEESGGLILHNAAPMYWQLGELQKALDDEREALEYWRARGETQGVAYAYTILGQFALQLGETSEAMQYQLEALKIWKMIPHPSGVAESTLQIGAILEAEGRRQDALERFQASLDRATSNKDARAQSKALLRIGGIHVSLGEHEAARSAYQNALELIRTAGFDPAAALKGLGDVDAATGHPERARESYAQALEVTEAGGDLGLRTDILLASARLEGDRGRLENARTVLEQATSSLESLRLTIANPDARASYLAARQNFYDLQIDVLMQLAREGNRQESTRLAFETSERARARGLLDSLAFADVQQKSIEPALSQREELVRQRVNGKATALARMNPAQRAGATAKLLRAEIEQLLVEHRQIRSEIGRVTGEGEALDTARIQAQLDAGTILLEYALGPERSYLFAVTKDMLTAFELPSRGAIEKSVRRIVELLPMSYRTDRKAQTTLACRNLSEMILAPAAHLLRAKRLAIVADGALQFVSFAVLADPSKPAEPLIAGHEIVVLPSASVIAALRRSAAEVRAITGELAVFADPVLTADDARLGGRGSRRELPRDLLRATSDLAIDLQPLPYTREEADRIGALVPEARLLQAVGFAANRDAVISGELEHYRRLHFATHGLLNGEHPELSGLVFSLYSEDGSPQDGFLRLNDIYNLRLHADLVVISACRSALGREVKREGLIGLTRGFMYAGAPRVVASLWDVRDAATAELMHRFYRRMMEDGMQPAAALRAAQISMWREPRWRAPFYWGAFVLQGDWE